MRPWIGSWNGKWTLEGKLWRPSKIRNLAHSIILTLILRFYGCATVMKVKCYIRESSVKSTWELSILLFFFFPFFFFTIAFWRYNSHTIHLKYTIQWFSMIQSSMTIITINLIITHFPQATQSKTTINLLYVSIILLFCRPFLQRKPYNIRSSVTGLFQ